MTKSISPLCQRMIDDMTMRNLSPSTQETYIRAVAQFSTFHRRSPDKLGVEHLREYHLHPCITWSFGQFHLREDERVEIFYHTTLRRPAIAGQIPMPRRLNCKPLRVPDQLEKENILRNNSLNGAPGLSDSE
jgi:integrase/recombinase XerD